jgi:hypothetical protein
MDVAVRRRSRVLGWVLLVAAGLLMIGPAPAEARPLLPPCDDAPAPVFADAGPYATHSSAIGCIGHLGITDGVSATRYGYDDPLQYGHLATFLARGLDASQQHGVALPLPIGVWFQGDSRHALSIDRLYEAGIIRDLDAFDPRASVSRGEMAVLVAESLRFAGVLEGVLEGEATTPVFTDVDGHPAAAAIQRLGEAGVVWGDGEGAFRPDVLLTRSQMATFVVNLLALIERGGEPLPAPAPPPTPPTPPPPPAPAVRAPEGWLIAPGNGPLVGRDGPIVRYTVEVADGLESRMGLDVFAERVEAILSDPDRGWTARGRHQLQRVDDPSRARIRVVLATPARVDQLCGRVGLNTAGIYSCWTGRYVALNATRWFSGVAHIADLELYRTYLVNHEVGHGLGYGHVSCPGTGRLAPVMVQQSMSFRMGGCVPNGWPYP